MKRLGRYRDLLTVICLLAFTAIAHAQPRVCFTPGENCTAVILEMLGQAKHSIRLQAYSFTSAPIAKALVDAQNRGVNVQAILDKTARTDKYSAATFLTHAAIPTWIDDQVAIAHNKVMIIDERIIVTGSFNLTKAAQERNAENLLVLDDPELVRRYLANWESRRRASARWR